MITPTSALLPAKGHASTRTLEYTRTRIHAIVTHESHTHESHTPCLFAHIRQAFIYFMFLVDLVITRRLMCLAHCNSVSSVLNYSTAPPFRPGSKHVIKSIQPSYNYMDSRQLSSLPYKALLLYICIFFFLLNNILYMRAVYSYFFFAILNIFSYLKSTFTSSKFDSVYYFRWCLL